MRFGLGGDWRMSRRKAEAPEADREKDTLLVGVGKRVRERRTGLRLTQIQAADACDVPQTLIFSAEAGLQNLTLKTLGKLAKGLNTTVRDLMPVTPEILEQERPPPQTLAEAVEKLDRVTQEAARLAQLVSFLLRHSQQAPHQHPSAGERGPEQ
ncbi:helix-turn-helix domain-containing protein [Muricoccus vinaceus]|uniref:Helix-turn-helix domain-containing protein n=1 Tax=Muricoccus vinaceus TaxID=424704 RepID=A0ABV6IUH4_9PROT